MCSSTLVAGERSLRFVPLILFFLAVVPGMLSAQVFDTAAIGWRTRPNTWSSENVFQSPLRFFPNPFALEPEVTVFTVHTSDSSTVPYGIRTWGHRWSNVGTYEDNVLYFGYNIPNMSGEPVLWDTYESKYANGNQFVMERHLEGRGVSSPFRRWESSMIDRTTGEGLDKSYAYRRIVFQSGNVGTQPVFWIATPAGSASLNSESSPFILHTNNVPFLRQINASRSAFVNLFMLNGSDAVQIGSLGNAADHWRPAAIDLQARLARLYIDGVANRYGIGVVPAPSDSFLTVAGGARFSGGVRAASPFGADSLTLATKGYADTRIADLAATFAAAISDSLARDCRTPTLIRDSLDANARGYVTDPVLSDSLDALPRAAVTPSALRDTLDTNVRGYVTARLLSDSLDALPREAVTPWALRDTLDANARGYVTVPSLSDTLDANARGYVTVPVLSDSLNTLRHTASLTPAALSDTLDANARGYVTIPILSDSLNTVRHTASLTPAALSDTLDANARGYVSSRILSDSLDALPRTAVTPSALRDTLDANLRGYVTGRLLSDSLDALPRAAVTPLALRDTLDANVRGYVSSRILSDSLDALPRAAVTPSALRDTLDANLRGYVTDRLLSDSLDALPRTAVTPSALTDTLDANVRGYVSGRLLSDSLDALPRTAVTRSALRDTLDANTRKFIRLETLTDSLDAIPRIPGVSKQELSDSLDANARMYISRQELTDSLDADPRVTVRPPRALASATIDWRAAEVFTDTLTATTAYTFINEVNGKTIVVAVTNPSNYQVYWPYTVRWPNNRPPSSTGGGKTDIYTFIRIGTTTYGTVVSNY
ncbi:MAG: hypothetical protein QHI48_10705 [Bacteroidota bacterium]|nr:hypothetical protein [Bacteroidota bacterium]